MRADTFTTQHNMVQYNGSTPKATMDAEQV